MERLGGTELAEQAPPGASDILKGLLPETAELGEGLGRILDFVRGELRPAAEEVLGPVFTVLAVSLLCALGEAIRREGGGMDYVTLGGCLAVSCTAAADVKGVLALGIETVSELREYSRVLLPTLAAAAASAGAAASVGAKYAAAALFSDLMLQGAQGVILPLICAFAASVMVRGALGTGQLDYAVKLLRQVTQKLMKWMVLALTGYLSAAGLVSGSADRAAVQALKTTLSAALPVVGKTLAEASASLIAGAGVVRNSVGLFGLLTVLAAVAGPVLRIGLRCLLYKAAAAVAAIFCGGRMGKLIDDIGTAYGMVLGLVGAAASFLLLSVAALMQSVSG